MATSGHLFMIDASLLGRADRGRPPGEAVSTVSLCVTRLLRASLMAAAPGPRHPPPSDASTCPAQSSAEPSGARPRLFFTARLFDSVSGQSPSELCAVLERDDDDDDDDDGVGWHKARAAFWERPMRPFTAQEFRARRELQHVSAIENPPSPGHIAVCPRICPQAGQLLVQTQLHRRGVVSRSLLRVVSPLFWSISADGGRSEGWNGSSGAAPALPSAACAARR